MAFVIAVYASRSGSPLTMQDSLLAVSHTLPDGIGYPQDHAERFPIAFHPPFPSFTWRNKSELLFFIVQAAYTVLTSSGSVPEAMAFAADLIAASL